MQKQLNNFLEELRAQGKYGDLKERLLQDRHMESFQPALTRCNPEHAPRVIAADNKWARDLMVADILYRHLLFLALNYPGAEEGLKGIAVPE